jgi:hypothetical protein
MFSEKFLRVTGELSTIPIGSIVYCFVDEGHQFRVKTDRDVCGVREIIFDNTHREKFEIYWEA